MNILLGLRTRKLLCLIVAASLPLCGKPCIGNAADALAPTSDLTAARQALEEKSAQEKMLSVPWLAAWAEKNAKLLSLTGYMPWAQLHENNPDEITARKTFAELELLLQTNTARNSRDARFLAKAFAALKPILKVTTNAFLKKQYPEFKRIFRKDLAVYEDGIMDLWVTSGKEDTERTNRVVERTAEEILDLKRSFKDKFALLWPLILEARNKSDKKLPLMLHGFSALNGAARLNSQEQFHDVGKVTGLLAKKTAALATFLLLVLPTMKRLARKRWHSDWGAVAKILEDLNISVVERIIPLLGTVGWEFKSLEDFHAAVRELKALVRQHPQDALERWVIQKKFGDLAVDQAGMNRLLNDLAGVVKDVQLKDSRKTIFDVFDVGDKSQPSKKDERSVSAQYLWFLCKVQIRNYADYQTTLVMAKYLLTMKTFAETSARARALIFAENIRPLDLALLLVKTTSFAQPDVRNASVPPTFTFSDIPITDEMLSLWHAFIEGKLGYPAIHGLAGPSLESTVSLHVGKAYGFGTVFGSLLHSPRLVLIPARAQFDTPDQARRLVEHLKVMRDSPFIQIGRIVAPDGAVLSKAPANQAQYGKYYKRAFGTTDNLFLIPVRNPLTYNEEETHLRSDSIGLAHGSAAKTDPLLIIGKGVGTPMGNRRDGVLASYMRGRGVHHFTGGLDSDEKWIVEEAESRMKEGLHRVLEQGPWRDLAEFFRIKEENLFLASIAEFQPLALPAYLFTAKAKKKLDHHRIQLPNQTLPPGLSLIRTQPLLNNMGVGSILSDSKLKKTGDIQRVLYYETSLPTRMRELLMRLSIDDQMERFEPFLKTLGFTRRMSTDPLDSLYAFRDVAGGKLNATAMKQYLLLGLIVRLALVSHILHHEMDASASNPWGRIFDTYNFNWITVFDYDTVILPGDERFNDDRRRRYQRKDIVNLREAILLAAELIRTTWGVDGEPSYDAIMPKSWDPVLFWRRLYEGRFDEALKDPKLLQTALGKQRLARFLACRAQPGDLRRELSEAIAWAA